MARVASSGRLSVIAPTKFARIVYHAMPHVPILTFQLKSTSYQTASAAVASWPSEAVAAAGRPRARCAARRR
eukprot:scaffold51278_cov58-Phaeocystis_antarctica.AAC.8